MKRLAEACEEAVRLHGADWPSVKAHIDRHLAGLSADEARRLQAAVDAAKIRPETGAGKRRPH